MTAMQGTRTLCLCCGEVWRIAEVRESAQGRFIRRGCLLGSCPACRGVRPGTLAPERRRTLETFCELAAVCGEDLETFGWFLEVFRLVSRRGRGRS